MVRTVDGRHLAGVNPRNLKVHVGGDDRRLADRGKGYWRLAGGPTIPNVARLEHALLLRTAAT
jgi:hypothetical protein